MINAYSYYLCCATSLPNVRDHHLSNMDPPPQLPMYGSMYFVIETMYPLHTWAPCAVSMGVDMGLRP